MTDESLDAALQQDTQALIKLAKLTQSLKHLGEAAKAVNLETFALAQHLENLLAGTPATKPAPTAPETLDFSSAAYETPPSDVVSFQDMERRQRYYAGLPPMDEMDAAFQQAMREAERRSRLAQGGLPLDDDDDFDE